MTAKQIFRRVMNRGPRWILRTFVFLIFVFMLGPIVITAATTINEGSYSRFPPQGFSLKWWQMALSPEWLRPLWFTFYLAAIVGFISLLFGLLLAFALTRYRFPGRDALSTLAFGPIILPNLVIGIALLQMFVYLGLQQYIGLTGLIIGHLVISLPYAVRTISVSLQSMPPNLELAAMNLGASRWIILKEITLPLIKSGIFAGTIFAFIHSFNDINVALFLSTPTAQVINIKILGHLEYGFEPVVAAVAMMTLVVPLLMVFITERYIGIGDFIYGSRRRR